MSQVRETIECLCHILFYHGSKKISAEAFRKAKYDKPEATESMWFALYCFTCLDEKRFAENECEKLVAPVEGEGDKIVRFCKHKMLFKGFTSTKFYSLPEDMAFGSRQVLISLGWLLANEKVINNLIKRTKSMLAEDPRMFLVASGYNDVGADILRSPRYSLNDFLRNLQNNLDSLIWLNGKMVAIQRKLLASKQEYALILSKAHTAVSQGATNHLSLQEVYLLRHQSELQELQELLENENSYFQSLLVWKRKQGTFWKWMCSILHTNHKMALEPSEDKCYSNFVKKPSDCLQKIKEQQVKLSKILHHHEQNYKKVCSRWKNIKTYVGACDLETSSKNSDCSGGLHQIEEEVFRALQTRCLSTDLEITKLGEVEVNFKPSRRIKLLHNKAFHNQTEGKQKDNSLSSIIEKLTMSRITYQQQLDCIRKNHQVEMLALSETLERVICIPVNGMLK